jgi:tetratricopeptide (TPR) repeat protein
VVGFVDVAGRLELDRALAHAGDLKRLAGHLDDALTWYAYSLCAGGGWVERDGATCSRQPPPIGEQGRPEAGTAAAADGKWLRMPSSEAAWVGAAQVRLSQRRWADAAAAYRAAVELCPRSVKAWTNLGLALSQQRKESQQQQQQQQQSQQPQQPQRSETDAAIAHTFATARADPTAAAALGAAATADDLLEVSLHAFRTAAALSDFDTEPLCNLGLLLGEVGRHAEAIEALQEASQRAARDRERGSGGCAAAAEADVQCRLGVALCEGGDVPGAAVAFGAALALDPTNSNARANAAAVRAALAGARA